jgi:MFS family permease
MIFIDSIGGGLIFPILPKLFLDNKNGLIVDNIYISREFLYGMSAALIPLCSIFGQPIFGRLSDIYGRKNIIYAGLGLLTLNNLVFIFSIVTHNVWTFFLAEIFGGFFAGTYSVGNALISDISGEDDNKRILNFKFITLSSVCGFILGPGISVINSRSNTYISLTTPFLIAFFLGISNLLLLFFSFSMAKISLKGCTIPSNYLIKRQKSLLIIFIEMFRSIIYVFTESKIRGLVFTYLSFQLGFSLFLQSLPLYLTVKYKYVPNQIGLFFVTMSILMTISMFLFQKVISKFTSFKKQMEVGLIFLTLLALLEWIWFNFIDINNRIDQVHTLWIIAGVFYMVAPFVALGFTNLFAKIGNKDEQGKLMGVSGQICGIAFFISGMLVGSLFTLAGNLVCVISTILMVVCYLRLRMNNSTVYISERIFHN